MPQNHLRIARRHHYYEILGLGYSATDEELRKAYRKLAVRCPAIAATCNTHTLSRHLLAVRYHPDKQKDEESSATAAEKFKHVTHAYKVWHRLQKRQACYPMHPVCNHMTPRCCSTRRSGRPTTTSSACYGRSRRTALRAAPPFHSSFRDPGVDWYSILYTCGGLQAAVKRLRPGSLQVGHRRPRPKLSRNCDYTALWRAIKRDNLRWSYGHPFS